VSFVTSEFSCPLQLQSVMFQRVKVVGRGRVGSAVAARFAERGHSVVEDDPELVMLCVPDSVIAEAARSVTVGPWICHTSGATSITALAPHTSRFTVHPLQTIVLGRGPEQLDGAWAAVSGDDADGVARASWVARELGLQPFELADEMRALYHAGAALASNYLVTLYRTACRAFEVAGAPPAALLPLMRRTIDNDFELTGPIARGDWSTVDAHLAALRAFAPELEPVYRALADRTR
jgi:predicted short-subunit dehydrogenase-like oxidoreductase (DUF2520 family)